MNFNDYMVKEFGKHHIEVIRGVDSLESFFDGNYNNTVEYFVGNGVTTIRFTCKFDREGTVYEIYDVLGCDKGCDERQLFISYEISLGMLNYVSVCEEAFKNFVRKIVILIGR